MYILFTIYIYSRDDDILENYNAYTLLLLLF